MYTHHENQIASVQTWLQRVSIHDLIRPGIQTKASYDKSLSSAETNGSSSYESQNPKLFLPDRLVFLDGVLQSRRSGDAPYHETLVHPAMFAHSNPKRVAIIGGGEAATLREVLKHNTVEQVVMVEIDEVMVQTSSRYLPEWSDCSNLVGSSSSSSTTTTPSCLDDPRATFYFEDALAWFMDRFSVTNQKIQGELPFDVIIMDALYVTLYTCVLAAVHMMCTCGVLARLTFLVSHTHTHETKKIVFPHGRIVGLTHQNCVCFFLFRSTTTSSDPQVYENSEGGEFAEALYHGQDFLQSLSNALTENGVLVAQLGPSPNYEQAAEDYSANQLRVKFVQSLGRLGFESMQDFDDVRKN
jgi:spermidine synthase